MIYILVKNGNPVAFSRSRERVMRYFWAFISQEYRNTFGYEGGNVFFCSNSGTVDDTFAVMPVFEEKFLEAGIVAKEV